MDEDIELTVSYQPAEEDTPWSGTRRFTSAQMAKFWDFWDQGEDLD